MSLNFVGIGDLHLDGKLKKYMEDLNSRIIHEVCRALEYATRNGVEMIVLYGDICETPTMSVEANLLFYKFLAEHPQFKFLIVLGNHDKENSDHHSLQMFALMCQFGALPHVKIIEKSTTMFAKSDTPLRLCPWPFLDTDADALNVIHEAVAGSHWDHGREVDGAKKMKHTCVAGHIHTAQTVGSTHFSGTLYQTSFGEKPKKYFHHVTWESGEEPQIKKIKHVPKFKLVNAVIESQADVDALDKDPNILYKAFIKSSAVLQDDPFAGRPNVVKTNTFKTKAELEKLIVEEIRLDDEFDVQNVLSVEQNLKDWLVQTDVEDDLKRRTFKKFKAMFGKETS